MKSATGTKACATKDSATGTKACATKDLAMTATQCPAGRSPKAWAVFGLTFAAGLAADLLSKALVFDWLSRAEPLTGRRQIIPGILRFTLSTNPGVVFGFDKMPRTLVVAATLLAVAVVVYFFITSPRRSPAMHAALGMILAGAVGNLNDRLFSHVQLPQRPPVDRHVRDFLDFGQLHYPWIFNVADVLLVAGLAILVLACLVQWRRQRRLPASPAR